MSGGSYDYIQLKDAEAILSDIGVEMNLERIEKHFKGYGEVGELAAAQTRAYAIKFERAKAIIELLHKELDEGAAVLHDVWRAADYTASGDWGREDLVQALEEHNANYSSTEAKIDLCAELAVVDACDDQTTTLEETSDRWQFSPELSPNPAIKTALMQLQVGQDDRQRRDVVTAFHQKLAKVRYLCSGQPVDEDFLLLCF